MTWQPHQMTWHDVPCHVATNHSSSPHVTSQPTTSLHVTPQATSWFMTAKRVTSPPWNSRRLVHGTKMVWASRLSVALRAFYRQILSLLYSSFSSETSAPGSPGNYLYWYITRLYSCWGDVCHDWIYCPWVLQISWLFVAFSWSQVLGCPKRTSSPLKVPWLSSSTYFCVVF